MDHQPATDFSTLVNFYDFQEAGKSNKIALILSRQFDQLRRIYAEFTTPRIAAISSRKFVTQSSK